MLGVDSFPPLFPRILLYPYLFRSMHWYHFFPGNKHQNDSRHRYYYTNHLYSLDPKFYLLLRRFVSVANLFHRDFIVLL